MIQLKDICDIYDCPHTTAKDEGKGYPLVRTPNVGKGRLILDGIHRVSEDVYNSRNARAIPEEGDLILAREAPVGNVSIIMDGQHVCLGQRVVLIKPKRELVDPYFLTYYLLSAEVQHRLKNHANGAVVAHLNVSDIRNLWVTLPELEEQVAIGKILRSIDDKIEVNRQINDNLELQAQTLYKSWFVDFEPFQNGKFIESELGLIPEGWKIGKINDVINLLSGFPFKSSDFQENGDYQLITIKGVQDGYLDVTSADRLSSLPSKMPQYCILNIGDILISLTGNVGRICIVDRNNLLLNQRVAILSPKNIRDSFYAYTMFRSESMKNELIHLARGTAQLNLSPIETGEKLTVIPPDNILEAFAKVGKGTFNQYISLKMENIRLMEMRDSLLPKLMSGELKINEIDC